MNPNHSLKESVSKTSKSQSVSKKSTKNLTEKQKPKQKSDKNRNKTSKVDDRHEEPVDHATKVKLIMEATMRSEEQVCWALQECDNDVDRAVDMLYENSDENSQWVKSGKKKKSKQQQTQTQDGSAAVTGKAAEYENLASDEINQPQQISYFKDSNKEFKSRDNTLRQSGTRGRRGGSNFTINRNRDSGERFDSRNAESGNGSRRGRQFDGNTASMRGNRGRGASRNTRTFQSKDTRTSYQPIETWDSSDVIKMAKSSEHNQMANNAVSDENWDQEFPIEDCYEEYTGSLADTKVFTPSIMTDKMNSLEKIESEMKSKASNAGTANVIVQKFSHVLDVQGAPQTGQNLMQLTSQNPIQVNTLTPAQTQYFNQLAQQTSESLKQQQQPQHHQISNYSPQYSNSYNSYSSSLHETSATSAVSQPLPTPSRNLKSQQKSSRISATSKIAANAVDMDYLNVQFSGLDLMSNNNLMDTSKDKYSGNQVTSAVNIDDKTTGNVANSQSAAASVVVLDAYSIPKSTSMVSQMKSSDINSEHLSSMASNYSQSRNSVSSNVTELSKANDHHNHHHQQIHPQQQQQQHQYSAYHKGTNAATMYQNYAPNTNYSNATNSYSQTNANYSGTTVATAAVVAAAAAAAANNLNNPNYYQNNSFANISQFPNYTSSLNHQSYYQNNNQLIFGANAASLTSNLTTNGATGVPTAYGGGVGPYSSHTGANNSSTASAVAAVTAAASQNKLNAVAAAVAVKDQQQVYDNATASLQSSTPSNVTPVSTNLNTTSSKLSTKGMMTNLAPIVSPQYIVGQTTGGIPFYQQPTAMYTIEDLQMLQSRIQHLPTAGYYEMGYQNSTNLAAGRDANAAATAIQNASYTMPDGRFARTDSSASPVPSTLSQQNSNQTHQGQPMLNAAALPAAYAYYYNTGMIPSSFQYGPTIYPQMAAPATANAHGTTNANQYAKATGYASAYNSGYDTMTQSQDFTKTNYLSGNVAAGGGSGVANAAGGSVSQVQNKVMNPVTTASNVSNDLSIMYAKQPHAAAATLGKINGFPSGTPQAYNLAGTQATGLGPNAAFTTQLFIPTIATHQHPNTTMIHQDSVNNSVHRSQTSNSAKNNNKQSIAAASATATGSGYPNSYWNSA